MKPSRHPGGESTTPPALEAAYAHCLAVASGHYENFPVASRFLPARLRRPVAVIYAFARGADDLADEGDLTPEARFAALDGYGARLDAASRGMAALDDPVFLALADVIARHRLPIALFRDLLSAFRQDVTEHRYGNFGQLLDYCRRSADPVGRLLLHLYDRDDEGNLLLSDRICSALQLINFLQDLAQDYRENGRIYLPQDEMARFGVGEETLASGETTDNLRALLAFQIGRARRMMLEGAPLGGRLPGRAGLELRLIIAGGLRILGRLEEGLGGDAFARPRLRLTDWLWMLGYGLFG